MIRSGFLVAVLSLSSAAHAQRLGGAATADISLVRVFLALLFCLIIAALAIFLLRQRYGGGRLPAMFARTASSSSRVRLVESRRIGPQSDVCLIEADGKEFLVLITAGGPLVLQRHATATAESE
jgi:flagellar biogenesis protein FliO